MNIERLDTNALFTQYVNVVNDAIGQNENDFPFRQLMQMGEKVLGDKKIGAAVYKGDPDSPHDYFTVRLESGRFRATHGKEEPDIEWKLDEKHLENVVSNPKPYVDNPAKLDLDWLETRLGNGAS